MLRPAQNGHGVRLIILPKEAILKACGAPRSSLFYWFSVRLRLSRCATTTVRWPAVRPIARQRGEASLPRPFPAAVGRREPPPRPAWIVCFRSTSIPDIPVPMRLGKRPACKCSFRTNVLPICTGFSVGTAAASPEGWLQAVWAMGIPRTRQ